MLHPGAIAVRAYAGYKDRAMVCPAWCWIATAPARPDFTWAYRMDDKHPRALAVCTLWACLGSGIMDHDYRCMPVGDESWSCRP